jgi:nitrogen fixation protein FixH
MSTFATPRRSWIPWVFASGMAVVIAVNAVLITAAFSSFPGLVVQRPYDRGIAYNDELRRSRDQAALGWSVVPRLDRGGLSVRIAAADGRTVDGLAVRARLTRPLDNSPAIEAELLATTTGYAAALSLPKAGQWELRLEATGVTGTYAATWRLDAS